MVPQRSSGLAQTRICVYVHCSCTIKAKSQNKSLSLRKITKSTLQGAWHIVNTQWSLSIFIQNPWFQNFVFNTIASFFSLHTDYKFRKSKTNPLHCIHLPPAKSVPTSVWYLSADEGQSVPTESQHNKQAAWEPRSPVSFRCSFKWTTILLKLTFLFVWNCHQNEKKYKNSWRKHSSQAPPA